MMAPNISLVRVPLKVTSQHTSRARIGEPFTARYYVENLSDEVLSIWTSIGADQNLTENQNFLVAGEAMSQVSLMPYTDPYCFQFTFVPTQLGMLDLPSFSISRARPERGKVGHSDMK